jgi:hypothetical protein
MTLQARRPVWRVTVTLCHVTPEVWRTILVRPETKLAMLHRYLQAAMGWLDYHLYAFNINGKEYGIPDRDWDIKIYDARRYTLERLFPSIPATFRYLYDFGDHWEHSVAIEGVQESEYRKQYPICIGGANACPPEDCGGPPGYEEVLKVLHDQQHPEHAEVAAWAASQQYRRDFYPRVATWMMRDARYRK